MHVDQVEIAEHAVEDQGNGDHEAMVTRWSLKGVEAVRHKGGGSNNGDQLVEQRNVVLFENLPVAAGLLLQDD